MRQSIQPTYDSRDTGWPYHVTYRVNGKTITFQKPIPDPFVAARVKVGWRALLWSILRGRPLTVEVLVSGDYERTDDVLELDANTLLGDSTRSMEFDAHLQRAVAHDAERHGSCLL